MCTRNGDDPSYVLVCTVFTSTIIFRNFVFNKVATLTCWFSKPGGQNFAKSHLVRHYYILYLCTKNGDDPSISLVCIVFTRNHSYFETSLFFIPLRFFGAKSRCKKLRSLSLTSLINNNYYSNSNDQTQIAS